VSESDDIRRRSELLAGIFRDPSQWHVWLVQHPGRLADVLGVCEDGKATITSELAPLFARVLRENFFSTGDVAMADDAPKIPVPVPGDDWAKLANTLINFLSVGLKEKKKVDRLKGLASAMSQTFKVKDDLIQKYEDGAVPPAKQQLAKDIHKKLKELQDLLNTLSAKIDLGEDVSNELSRASVLVGVIQGMISQL